MKFFAHLGSNGKGENGETRQRDFLGGYQMAGESPPHSLWSRCPPHKDHGKAFGAHVRKSLASSKSWPEWTQSNNGAQLAGQVCLLLPSKAGSCKEMQASAEMSSRMSSSRSFKMDACLRKGWLFSGKNGGSLQISTWCYGGPRYNPTLHWNIVPTKSQLHIPTLHSNRIPSLPKAVYQNQLVKCLGTQNYILQGNAGPSTSFPKSRHNSTANKGPSKFRRTAALMLSRTVEKAKACSVVAWSKSNLAGNFSWNFGIQRVPTNLKKRSVWKKYTFIGRYEI